MPPVYELSIVAPDHQVYTGRVQSVVAPGQEGSLGVLANHAPMIVELTVGELRVVDERGETRSFAISGGVLEVNREGVSVLADTAEAAVAIDVTRAQSAEQRARTRLTAADFEVDHDRAAAALQRALNRLRVAAGGR